MKICINQYAFIAAILCISTALHTDHAPMSPEAQRLMYDQSATLTDSLEILHANSRNIQRQYQQAQLLDYKDKSITAKRRNEIRKLQRQARTARSKINLQIKNIQRLIGTTSNQIEKAAQQSADNIQSTHLAALRIPAE